MKKLFILLFLSSCAPHTVGSVCPSLVPYSHQEQAQLNDEIKHNTDNAMTIRFLNDYAGLRAQARACVRG